MAASPLSITNINNAWIAGLSDSGLSLQLITDWQHNKKLFKRFTILYHQLATLPRAQRRTLQRQWRHTLAGIAILMALGSPAMSATIRVNNNCNLVDAITAANTDTATGLCRRGNGADQIILPANSTQTLTTINNSTYADGSNGLPIVESIITIVGNGSTITRDSAAPEFRILAVDSDGDLTLQDSTISGGFERSFPGGGGISNNGLLTIMNSTLTNNRAYFNGGGINNDGVLTIIDSSISNNLASEYNGGGIFNRNELIIQNSEIIDNLAYRPGGGISNSGSITITRSTVSDNRTFYFGGGLSNYGTATISGSTISGNTGYSAGGGIYNPGTLTVTNSTISANKSIFPVFGLNGGGGIYNCNKATLINTTISGNTSHSIGGGVRNANVDFFYYCNSSNKAYLTLNNTLISGNDLSYAYAIYGHEISSDGSVSTDAFNLLGHSGLTNAEAFVGFTSGTTDITATSDGTDPTALASILDTNLADNGGLTQTHALVTDSPAIDAVTDNSCHPPATDQRGVERPQDGDDDNSADCDIGAYEFQIQALQNVNIDIKPGNKRNPINPLKQGGVWVAVLSDTQAPFDPTSQVDITSILFGPDGAEIKRARVKDINKDGVSDLILRFSVPATSIMCGDTEATLSGETFSGDSIQGTEFIQTKGCKKSKRKGRK